ncbi:unnamed protein product [Allacma fusca]|uniref:Ubiquitin-like domain-containing protein n=1 Tax=Allacma fusca TaxID=39272 RepID=A0A8J2JQL2_9HEXA|nr:unnamed protein product [Allacma fusca]
MHQDDCVESKIKSETRKRKLHRRPSGRGRDHRGSSTDSDDDTCVSVKLKFSLSQSTQSFNEIFAEGQATLRQQSSKYSMEDFDEEELPSIEEASREPSPVDALPPKRSKIKKKKKKEPRPRCNVSNAAVTLTHALPNRNGLRGSISQVSSSYLSVADMDTDTELDFGNPPAHSNGDEQEEIEEIVLSSSDDEIRFSNHTFAYNTYETRHNVVRQPLSPNSVPLIDLSSRSPSPESDSPPPPKLDRMDDTTQQANMRVRIRYRNDLYEFDGSQFWDLEKVRETLGEMIDVPESELLIYTESEQKMVDGKTLMHYNVKCGDVLEALRKNADRPVCNAQALISLKFQKDGLRRPICMNVSKYSSLKEIRTSVAREIFAEEKKLLFRIDGEYVDLCKTPDELDLEDDVCVDVYEKQ